MDQEDPSLDERVWMSTRVCFTLDHNDDDDDGCIWRSCVVGKRSESEERRRYSGNGRTESQGRNGVQFVPIHFGRCIIIVHLLVGLCMIHISR